MNSVSANEAKRTPRGSNDDPARTMTGIIAELDALLDGNETLAAARGIARAALDSLYGAARELYACGHRAEALGSLELLCLYDHETVRYWQALGACRQANGDHFGAAAALAFAIGQSDEFDGSLEIQLIECLAAAGQTEAAAARLRKTLETAGERHAGEPWHVRARLLQTRLAKGAASQ